jgi:hypothetical protein
MIPRPADAEFVAQTVGSTLVLRNADSWCGSSEVICSCRAARLRLSSQLLKLATIVKDQYDIPR